MTGEKVFDQPETIESTPDSTSVLPDQTNVLVEEKKALNQKLCSFFLSTFFDKALICF